MPEASRLRWLPMSEEATLPLPPPMHCPPASVGGRKVYQSCHHSVGGGGRGIIIHDCHHSVGGGSRGSSVSHHSVGGDSRGIIIHDCNHSVGGGSRGSSVTVMPSLRKMHCVQAGTCPRRQRTAEEVQRHHRRQLHVR